MEGLPVLTAHEMARVEKEAISNGASGEEFMDRAAAGIAREILKRYASRPIILLVGKGNNGGDALAVGSFLLENDLSVTAYIFFPLSDCSELCQKKLKAFTGPIKTELEDFPENALIVDGLLGTGFEGELTEPLKSVIEKANAASCPILAIDIPSALAINATETVTLGAAKTCLFTKEGFNHIGKLTSVDFGLDLTDAHIDAYLIDEKQIKALRPKSKRTQHKYEAGYILAVAGSPGMPGAACLSCLAALRSGAGIVRLFHPPGMEEEIAAEAPLELVRTTDFTSINEEAKRASALLIGPGMGRTPDTATRFKEIISATTLPTVIDADGLYHLSHWPDWKSTAPTVLTPHHGEMKQLCPDGDIQKFAEEKNVTIVYKGAPTYIYHPGEKPLISLRGDPGMATAGTGDVLTGIIAALLAQGLVPREAAALGVHLHGVAGERAAFERGSKALIASDLLDFIFSP